MTYDFTMETYEGLCKNLVPIQEDCRFIHFLNDPSGSKIILRHDVDRKPKNALRMARLENGMGIRATYYFRCERASFDADIIREISEMGHEIGYHYEVMRKAKGDVDQAMILFKEEINRLNSISEIRTACMHGSPESRYNNGGFWNDNDMASCGIVGEAYQDIPGRFEYFTDTGGEWNGRNNLRDRVKGCHMPYAKSTRSMVDSMLSGNDSGIYINCHPERWSQTHFESTIYRLKDFALNLAKRTVFRSHGDLQNVRSE
jgi:hypothetical protein